MTRMMTRSALTLLVLATAAVGSTVAQEVTISDWSGRELTVTQRSVDNDGVRVVYHTAGDGPLVVFVHSIFGPWFDWRHQMPALAEHYQVASMSTRGTDESDKPEGVEHYTMSKISSDIAAIIADTGHDSAILVGQDSGGLYAWHFAMTHPEQTERLISFGTVHPAGLLTELIESPAQQEASMFQRGMQENPGAGDALAERIRSNPQRPGDTPELTELRRAAFDRLYPESIVNFYKANWPVPPFTEETEGFGFRLGEFPPVTVPTLVFYGENGGAFTPPTLNDLWEHIDARVTLEVLPGVGHGPHTEAPEVVTPRVMEWLGH